MQKENLFNRRKKKRKEKKKRSDAYLSTQKRKKLCTLYLAVYMII